MRRATDFKPSAHPGSLLGDYAETEATRRAVLSGNGADEEPDRHDNSEDGWTVLP